MTSDRVVAAGERRLGVRVRRLTREPKPSLATGPGLSEFTLLIDGEAAGRIESRLGFANFISWSGLDIGRDRGSPVSRYDAPFEFTGRLLKVTVTMDDDQRLDGGALGARNWRGSNCDVSGQCLAPRVNPDHRLTAEQSFFGAAEWRGRRIDIPGLPDVAALQRTVKTLAWIVEFLSSRANSLSFNEN